MLDEISYNLKLLKLQSDRHSKLLGEDDPEKSVFLLVTLLDSRIHILEKHKEEVRDMQLKINVALIGAGLALAGAVILRFFPAH